MRAATDTLDPDRAAAPAPLGLSRHVRLSAYWFAQNFLWGAMLTVLIPTEVLRFAPEGAKASYTGAIAALGALVATLAHPVIGLLSDRTRSRWGRRRPYVLTGSVAASLALLAMAGARSLTALLTAFLLLQLASNVALAAYQAYIPDLVPPRERGATSGYMGLMSILGSISSLAVAGALVRPDHTWPMYPCIGGVVLAGAAVTVWGVTEGGSDPAPDAPRPRFWVSPRQAPDFWWVLVTRALVMMAFYTLLAFLEYFLKDVLGLADYVRATTVVSGVALLVAVGSCTVAGRLSDALGRKRIVSVAGILMGIAALAFTVARGWPAAVLLGVLFGLGYGAYLSVDWALAVDVLPGAGASAAKDLGIWSVSITLPQVLAPAAGGPLITALDGVRPLLGYRLVFGLTFLYALAGSLLVWRVRSAR